MSFPTPDKLAQNAGNPIPGFNMTGKVAEPKYDGFRLLVHIGDGVVDTFTRTGNSQSGKLPHIEAALVGLPDGTWLDGELVCFSNDGTHEWGSVQSVMGSNVPEAARKSHVLTFVAFDVLAFDGHDIRPLPLSERRAALEVIIGMVDEKYVRATPQFPASDDAYDQLIALGWEGAIVKDPSLPYASGKRGHGWTKMKASDELDVVITGFESGSEFGAIVFGQYKDGALTVRGKCKRYANGKALKQGDVISVAHMGIMPSGSPRHAMYKRLRIDKSAQDCIWT